MEYLKVAAQRIPFVAQSVFNDRRRQLAAAGLFCAYRYLANFPAGQSAVSLGVVLLLFLFLQEEQEEIDS